VLTLGNDVRTVGNVPDIGLGHALRLGDIATSQSMWLGYEKHPRIARTNCIEIRQYLEEAMRAFYLVTEICDPASVCLTSYSPDYPAASPGRCRPGGRLDLRQCMGGFLYLF